MFNSLLADKLKGLNLQPKDLSPNPASQHPRCVCHNKYLDECPTLWMRDAQHRPGPIDTRTGNQRVADVRKARLVKK